MSSFQQQQDNIYSQQKVQENMFYWKLCGESKINNMI